jgi:large repetitive protein
VSPDYLDNIFALNLLPETATTTNAFLIECDPSVRCRLGQFSLSVGGGSKIDLADVPEITEDTEFDNVGGLFDFEVNAVPVAGQSIRVVVPQTTGIPSDAVYRKYQNGTWTNFSETASNSIHSAPGMLGYCPPPGASNWQSGLNAGDFCVQLTIEDGGPNDADGTANNRVEDPGGVAVTRTTSSTNDSGGGGGIIGWLGILALLFSWHFSQTNRQQH